MFRRKALIVSRNLPPIQGGIERLMGRVVDTLVPDYECYVIGPSGCKAALPPGVHACEVAPFVPWFLFRGALQVLLWRLRHRFALVVAGNGLVAPLARLGGRCWIAFVHGLDLVAPYRLYQWGFVPALRRAAAVVANSRHTRELAIARGIAGERVHVVHPGVASPASAPAPGDFRARFGLPAGPLLLSVGRLVPRKGYAEFIARALPAVLQRFPSATYAIVGAEAPHAANPVANMRARIAAAADAAGVGHAVRLLGAISDADLAAAYAEADVLVFPSLGGTGDVEGFGMVLLEAAAHGTPAAAFDTGGVGDAVGPGSGVLVPEGDFTRFAGAVASLLAGEAPGVSARACRAHAGASGWSRFAGRVREIARAAECAQ